MAPSKRESPSPEREGGYEVLQRFGSVSRYEVRLLRRVRPGGGSMKLLDIRERIVEGGRPRFTRRAVEIGSSKEALELRRILDQVIEGRVLPDPVDP